MTTWLDSVPLGAVADLLVRATVLMVVAHGTLFLMRRHSAAARELTGRWFLIALCLLPLLTLSGLTVGILPEWGARGSAPGLAPETFPAVATLDAGPVDPISPRTSVMAGGPDPSWTWSEVAGWALGAWAAGACAFFASLVLGHVSAQRRLFGGNAAELSDALRARLGIEDAGLAWVSPRAAQPGVAGLWRARIALPPAFLDWPRDRQRAVLAHERAHVDRRDGLAVFVWLVARALWWPHLLVWPLGRRLALLREQACDDRVLRDGVAAVTYAAALVDTARDLRSTDRLRSPVLSMTTTSQLEARVRAVLRADLRRAELPGPARAVAAALALALGFVCATGRSVAQGETPPSAPRASPTAPTELPTSEVPAAQTTEQDPDSILLALTRDGKVVCDGREIGIGGVEALVRRSCEKGNSAVVIEYRPDTPAGLLVQVVDHAKAGGAEQVAIRTPPDAAASLRLVSGNAAADAVPIRILDAAPRVVDRPRPKVAAALRAHLPATVWVGLVVNEQGNIAAAEALKSTDERFHQTAIDAASQWRFEPGLRDGKPVPFRVRVPINFFADSSGSDTDPRGDDATGTEPAVVPPRPTLRVAPTITPELRAHMPAIVWLSFVVDHEGRVTSAKVRESTDTRFDQAALDAIAQWRFQPGTRRGEPLTMETRVPISFVEDPLGNVPPDLEGEMEMLDLKELERRVAPKTERDGDGVSPPTAPGVPPPSPQPAEPEPAQPGPRQKGTVHGPVHGADLSARLHEFRRRALITV